MIEPSRAASGHMAFVYVLLLATGVAGAADTATKSSGSAPILTPAQLKDCVNQKAKLRAMVDNALKDKASVDADQAEIERLGTELGGQVATLDRTSAEAVTAYNDKVLARNKMIESHEAKIAAYNSEAEAVQAGRSTYAKSCENRRYDERDLSDPKAKK
jgi:hypothetical protein